MLSTLVTVIIFTAHAYGGDVFVNETSTCILVCPFPLFPGQTLYWRGPPNQITYSIGFVIVNSLKANRTLVSGNNGSYILQIYYTNKNDEGVYSCNVDGQTSENFTLIITEGPQYVNIYPSTISYTVREADNVGPITCMADCKPSCTYTWSGPYRAGENMSTLFLQNINRNQTAYYQCIARNYVSSMTSVIVVVNVNYGPGNVIITPLVLFYTVRESSNISSIRCIADCNPNCTIAWSGPNLPYGTTSVLSLQNIDRSQNGSYQCLARNYISSMASVIFLVYVNYGPRLVSISPSISFYTIKESSSLGSITCTADCNPNCIITWIGPNLPYGNTSTLNLQNINRNQTGSYHCVASNNVSAMLSMVVVVDVNYGPSFVNINPAITDYTLNETNNVGPITCTADCKPNCSVTWSGPNIPGGTAYILIIQNIDRTQAGNYYCTAWNYVSNISSSAISFTVNYGPRFVSISPTTSLYTVKEGTSLGSINCTADCKPLCIFTWSGPNLSYGNTSVLNLQNIDRNQTGSYQCTTRNYVGTSTSMAVVVDVNYGPNFVTIYPAITGYTLNETDSVGPITCTADCKPNCTFTWSGPNLPGGTASKLILQNIDRIQAGNYQCTARNNASNMSSFVISIAVNYGPRFVNINAPTLAYTVIERTGRVGPITCSADCKPNCTVTWEGPNLPVNTGSILNLTEIDKNQAGKYYCTTGNYVSNMTSTSYLTIDVNYGPSQVFIHPHDSIYTIEEGDKFGPIVCSADCKPVCSLLWTGPNLPLGTSNLYIANIRKNQAGNFQCTARNDVNFMSSNVITVTVKYLPTAPTFVQVVCKYTSAVLTWTPELNGILEQHSKVQFWKVTRPTDTVITENIKDVVYNNHMQYTIESLLSQTSYGFMVYAVNVFGNSSSKIINCTTDSRESITDNQEGSAVLAAGISTIIIGILIALFVLAFILVRRFRKDANGQKRIESYADINLSNLGNPAEYDTLQHTAVLGHQKDNKENKKIQNYEESNHASNKKNEHTYANFRKKQKGAKKKNKDGIYANVTA